MGESTATETDFGKETVWTSAKGWTVVRRWYPVRGKAHEVFTLHDSKGLVRYSGKSEAEVRSWLGAS